MITLPKLPYSEDALSPTIKATTINIHYNKHHQGYVNKINELIIGTPFENTDIETIIKTANKGPIFNNAAQVRNHTFYRNSLRPAQEKNTPTKEILEQIEKKRGTFEKYQEEFIKIGTNNFGSGRTWLAKTQTNELEIINTSNAGTPLRPETIIGNEKNKLYTPLFTIDVREHAYYLDYQNRRIEYLNNIRSLINREFVEKQYHI